MQQSFIVASSVLGPRSTVQSTAHGSWPLMMTHGPPAFSRLQPGQDGRDCDVSGSIRGGEEGKLVRYPFPPFIIAANGLVLPGSRW